MPSLSADQAVPSIRPAALSSLPPPRPAHPVSQKRGPPARLIVPADPAESGRTSRSGVEDVRWESGFRARTLLGQRTRLCAVAHVPLGRP
jgi:hypothetical protein